MKVYNLCRRFQTKVSQGLNDLTTPPPAFRGVLKKKPSAEFIVAPLIWKSVSVCVEMDDNLGLS